MSTQSIAGNKTGTRSRLTEVLTSLTELSKIKITVFVAFTTALGYIVAAGSYSPDIIFPVAGIFLLACSSAMLNHIQEWKHDSLMDRTMYRPIPFLKISLSRASVLAAITFVVAVLILYLGSNTATLVTGLVALVWYNLIYTPLKRKTSLAIIPGSVVGALPPLAGWFAAGGSVYDFRIWLIFAFFFLWQIPHFWLLLLIYKDDYKKAGFPVFTDRISSATLLVMIKLTTAMTAAVAVVYSLTGELNYFASVSALLISSFAISFFMIRNLNGAFDRKKLFRAFISVNFFTLFFITILILDKLIKVIL